MKSIELLVPILPFLLVIFGFFQCSSHPIGKFPDRDRLFNNDWKFIRDSIQGVEHPEFDDSNWMVIDLPHDYSIMNLPGRNGADQIGPFSKRSPGNGNSTGHVLGGTGWYRKHFTLDKSDAGKTTIINFDGVYMESEVWVNGKKAGVHKNGYTPFWFDITSLLNEAGSPNVIAVKVENVGRSSRWYSGSGIYRDVHLTITQPVHIAVWGVKITTPEVTPNESLVNIEIDVQNDSFKEASAQIIVNIKDNVGRLAATAVDNIILMGNGENSFIKQFKVENALLWSIETPNLYTAEIIIKSKNKISDIYNQTFGIRSIEISPEKGFVLNGKPVLLKGGCLHHDNGFLGSAAYTRAEERKVELMKASGYNAIRCAHNPPSSAFLNACDRQGMLVIDEFSDMWESYKNPQDYSRFFKEWWNKDLTDMILRDRNHPSIIMWSIGNEIPKNTVEDGIRIAKQLTVRIKELDNTRYITEAVTSLFTPGGWQKSSEIFDILDVCGYNYKPDKYKSDHELLPKRIMYGSESFPLNAYEYWKAVEKFPYVIGDFVWSAMDYLGEVSIANSTYVPESQKAVFRLPENLQLPAGFNIFDFMEKRPSNWPYFVSWCGDVDITGEKKPQSLYRDVLWGNSLLEINVHEYIPEGQAENISGWGWAKEWPIWNWKGDEGKPLLVRIFTKKSAVRLELNGQLIGEKKLSSEDEYIASFNVPYKPGELKAIAFDDGKEIASKILKTAGDPVAIKLVADRKEIKADRNDLSFVKIEIVDESGQIVPTDSIKLNLEISGNGELIGSGSADPGDMSSVNQLAIRSYKGKALAIIRPFITSGEVKFLVTADGLRAGQLGIKVK